MNLKGIDVYRYMLPAEALASPAVNPDNQCYCTDTVLTKNCTMAGLLDMTPCRGQCFEPLIKSAETSEVYWMHFIYEFPHRNPSIHLSTPLPLWQQWSRPGSDRTESELWWALHISGCGTGEEPISLCISQFFEKEEAWGYNYIMVMRLVSFVDYRIHSEICKKASAQHVVRPICRYCVCKQT